MTDLTDVAESARIAYEAGIDPIDYAEHEIATLIRAHFAAAVKAALSPGVPHPDLSTETMSRRIVGLMLNSGWEVPGGIEIPEEVPGE